MISVIIPIYNVSPDYIRKCLDSASVQTFSDMEILLIDDGSKPHVAEVCREYQENDRRFRYLRQENKGVAGARNAGVRNAAGEYICFVDPDDWLDDTYLETLYSLICSTGADIAMIDAVVHYKHRIKDNHFLAGRERVLAGTDKNELICQLLSRKICSYSPPEIAAGVTWAKMYRKQFLIDNQIWSVEGLKRMQDNVLNMYAFEKASAVAYKPVCLYHYRKTEGSASNRFNPHIVEDFEHYYREAEMFLRQYSKEQILWEALFMKELTSFHSYLRFYYFHRKSGFSRREANRRISELLTREPYKDAMNHISRDLLTGQEYVFVTALKRRMFFALRMMIRIREWGKERLF